MNSNLFLILDNDKDKYNNKIISALSSYTEKKINEDGSVDYKEIDTNYFLNNNSWSIDFFRSIPQFNNISKKNKYFNFKMNNYYINNEIKFVTHNIIFLEKWKLTNALNINKVSGKKLAEFINERYPTLNSILDLDLAATNSKWLDWLVYEKKIKIEYLDKQTSKLSKKKVYVNTQMANYFKTVYGILVDFLDDRDEWDKDIWDIRKLNLYGIKSNKSSTEYFINFKKIDNINIRKAMKIYLKQRLINNDNFSWNTARSYMTHIPRFINFITELEPRWNDFKNLNQLHIEKYVEWVNLYVKNNPAYKENNKDELHYYLFKDFYVIFNYANMILHRLKMLEY